MRKRYQQSRILQKKKKEEEEKNPSFLCPKDTKGAFSTHSNKHYDYYTLLFLMNFSYPRKMLFNFA